MHRLVVLALAGLAGCAAGPDYVKLRLDLPPAWQVEAPWRASQPGDALDKGPWWQSFADPTLARLEQQALDSSPTLALANARLAQSRALLASSQAALLPQVGLSERASRQKISANRPLANYNSPNFSTVQNDLTLAMSVSYEVDLAGRVQRSVEGAQASAEQAAADFENTRLLLTADVASAYFNLRAVDAEIDAVGRALSLQRRALALISARRDLGAASGLEVAQQQALLDGTLVQLELLRRQRGPFEHALATLVGVPAPGFLLAADPGLIEVPSVPAIPLGLPSDLLERRPDVAAAERAVAAANAQIGIASAAFFPSMALGGNLGVERRELPLLFNAPSLLWSVGVSATQALFDGGRMQANVDFARAGHVAAVAGYRRVVLQAMQEVEDGITGLSALERAAAQAQVAVDSAARVLQMATARYEGGASTYLEVINAQQGLLAAERQTTQLRGQRWLTAVFLFKALGGDWRRG
jgi:NodT family efflux transporter outer membrane factor (OMF) lipoprotein